MKHKKEIAWASQPAPIFFWDPRIPTALFCLKRPSQWSPAGGRQPAAPRSPCPDCGPRWFEREDPRLDASRPPSLAVAAPQPLANQGVVALRGGDGWETPALVVVVLVDLLKGDCRGIVRTQRLRHAQPAVSLFLPQPIQSPSNNRDTRGKADGPISQDAQKQNEAEEGKEKKQTQRKSKAGLLGPFSLPTGPHAFLSTSPAVSIFITTAVQEDHQSACMVGWGMGCTSPQLLRGRIRDFDETRRDAMRWFQ